MDIRQFQQYKVYKNSKLLCIKQQNYISCVFYFTSIVNKFCETDIFPTIVQILYVDCYLFVHE